MRTSEKVFQESLPQKMARIRQGDDRAAAWLVQQYEAEIRTEARFHLRDHRLCRVLDSMDICQSVLGDLFVQVASGKLNLESPQDLIKLLICMARNKVLDHIRREQAACRDCRRTRSLEHSIKANLFVDNDLRPDEQILLQDEAAHWKQRLSEQEQEIAQLRSSGYTWLEIGRRLKKTADAARKSWDRAVHRLAAEAPEERW